MKFKIIINGVEECISNRITTVDKLLDEKNIDKKYIAIAINKIHLPKDQYKTKHLRPNDKIEILKPIYGG